jgi:hypothetical protein
MWKEAGGEEEKQGGKGEHRRAQNKQVGGAGTRTYGKKKKTYESINCTGISNSNPFSESWLDQPTVCFKSKSSTL